MSKRSGKHRESAKQYEDYPDQEYPDQEYPDQEYPAQQYPDQQYPAQEYPAQQYPAQQYPAQQYPAQQYPAQQFPAQQYPAQQYIYEECEEFPDPFYSTPRPDNQPTTSDQDLNEQLRNTHLSDNKYQAQQDSQTSASTGSSYAPYTSTSYASTSQATHLGAAGRSQKGRRDSSSRNNPPAPHSKDKRPRTKSFAGGSKDVPRSSTRNASEANGYTYPQEDQEGVGSGEPPYDPPPSDDDPTSLRFLMKSGNYLRIQAIKERRTLNLIDRERVKDLGHDDKMVRYERGYEKNVRISSTSYKAIAKIDLEWYEEPASVDSRSTFYVCRDLPYGVYLARQSR